MKIWLAMILLSALPAAAQSATLRLKDGGTLQGVIVSSSTTQITLRTAQGEVQISTDRVLDIENGAAPVPAPALAPAPETPAYRIVPYRRVRLWEQTPLKAGDQMVTFDLGLIAPTDDVSFSGIGGGSASNGDVGPLVGLQYFYFVTPRLALGPGFEYFHRSATASFGLLPNAFSNVYGDTLSLQVLARYFLTDKGRTRPYLLAGVGPALNSTTIDATPLPGYGWQDTGTGETRQLINDSAWVFSSTLRLGIDFHVFSPSVFGLEAGWNWLSEAGYAATAQGKALGLSQVSAPLSTFVFAARFGWRFE